MAPDYILRHATVYDETMKHVTLSSRTIMLLSIRLEDGTTARLESWYTRSLLCVSLIASIIFNVNEFMVAQETCARRVENTYAY